MRSFLPQLLRKYIAYARQHVHPRLTGALGLVVHKTASGTACGWNRWFVLRILPRLLRYGCLIMLPGECHCPPYLTAGEAMEVLKAYYLQLRAASAADPGSLPVTARQLESLVRVQLAEAHPHCLPNHATPLLGAMPQGAVGEYCTARSAWFLPQVRLSEARARVELREEVTRADAEVGAVVALRVPAATCDCAV